MDGFGNSKKEILIELNSLSQLFNIVLVTEMNGEIKKSKTIKTDQELKVIEESVKFNLKTHRIDVENSNQIHLIDTLIEDIAGHSKENTIFSRNIIQKFLFPIDSNQIIKKIISNSDNFSWIIVNTKLINLFTKNKLFLENEKKSDEPFYLAGKIQNLNVYCFPYTNEEVYFGNFETLTLIMNQNTTQNNSDFLIYYSLIKSGEISRLKIR